MGRRDGERDDGALDAARADGTGVTAASTAARIDDLVARACAETGLEDFGGDTWREGLEVLVGSALAESRFNDFGEQMFYRGLVHTLANRLRIEDWFARHPEIDEQEVSVELLGVGFPRTGSTALSHLLGEDRGRALAPHVGVGDAVPAARGVARGRRRRASPPRWRRSQCRSRHSRSSGPCFRSRRPGRWKTTSSWRSSSRRSTSSPRRDCPRTPSGSSTATWSRRTATSGAS